VGRDSARSPNIETLRANFEEHGQEHVFGFWDELGEASRERLCAQASHIDLSSLARAYAKIRSGRAVSERELEPAEVVRIPERGGDAAAARSAGTRGEEILASGRVGIMVVAGGQGTRLGFDGPKGAFPIGPVTDRTLFEIQAQKILGLRRRSGQPLPWYVMTSDATDAPTREFFDRHDSFGLPPEDVYFFQQGMVPSIDFKGRLFLEQKDRVFENPNGHGGSLTALLDSGALEDMAARGIDTIFYYQVDNPLVRIGDPVYLGLHDAAGADMSCKVIEKQKPGENVGIVARVNGTIGMVEYTELEDEHRYARDANGDLVYWTGNVAIHIFNTDFVRRVASAADELLPYHASAKKIPHVDADGRPVTPEEPNGHKLERFVFDALPAARTVRVVEAGRTAEYSPVKNADGVESPATVRRDLVAQYRGWLETANVSVPDGQFVEIDHSMIDGPEEARAVGIKSIEEAGETIQIAPGTEL